MSMIYCEKANLRFTKGDDGKMVITVIGKNPLGIKTPMPQETRRLDCPDTWKLIKEKCCDFEGEIKGRCDVEDINKIKALSEMESCKIPPQIETATFEDVGVIVGKAKKRRK